MWHGYTVEGGEGRTTPGLLDMQTGLLVPQSCKRGVNSPVAIVSLGGGPCASYISMKVTAPFGLVSPISLFSPVFASPFSLV